MGVEENEGGRSSGDEIRNYFEGKANGPVFQSGRIGDVNIGMPFPDELLDWYRRDRERLAAEESARSARQEALSRRWDALVAKHAKIKRRLVVAMTCLALSCAMAISSVLVSRTIVDDVLWVATWMLFVVTAALVVNFSKSRRRMDRHEERAL